MRSLNRIFALVLVGVSILTPATRGAETKSENADSGQPGLRMATFEVDATPPLGTPLSVKPAKEIVDPLTCRGIVLLPGDQPPIVLAAIDWIGIANGGYDAWRATLAEAAGTSPERVAVHYLHQHDAPSFDADAQWMLYGHGIQPTGSQFKWDTLRNAADAIREAVPSASPVTHVGLGKAEVEKFASNRRLLGPEGEKVIHMRWTTENQAKWRAVPEGLIDPDVQVISLWNGEEPLATLSYYATHPQSHYGEGGVSSDTVGIARRIRQEQSGVFHVHFNGAGGNIGAGKYNPGDEKYRMILARRLADGMKRAWENTEKSPITAGDVGWGVHPAALPLADHLDEQRMLESFQEDPRSGLASEIAFVRRTKRGDKIDITCLRLGEARVLHMPGELFVEYQLAAKKMRPDLFVAMAAYGDGGPDYIGTRAAYPRGGYEVADRSTNVAPSVEAALTQAIRDLLGVPEDEDIATPSELTNQKMRIQE